MILSESCYQFSVFCLRTDGDTQTVLTELYAMAVAHDDAFVHQIVVDLGGIGHLGEEEIGLGGIHLHADGQQLEGVDHTGAFLEEDLDPFVDLERIFLNRTTGGVQ